MATAGISRRARFVTSDNCAGSAVRPQTIPAARPAGERAGRTLSEVGSALAARHDAEVGADAFDGVELQGHGL